MDLILWKTPLHFQLMLKSIDFANAAMILYEQVISIEKELDKVNKEISKDHVPGKWHDLKDTPVTRKPHKLFELKKIENVAIFNLAHALELLLKELSVSKKIYRKQRIKFQNSIK